LKNKHHARYTFLRTKQERREKIGSYVSRLREKANDCEFGETMQERILDQCIQSVDNKELIRKAISKGWALDKFIEEAA
jgi:predicted ATP-binding protein involved in virulence